MSFRFNHSHKMAIELSPLLFSPKSAGGSSSPWLKNMAFVSALQRVCNSGFEPHGSFLTIPPAFGNKQVLEPLFGRDRELRGMSIEAMTFQ